ncbi:MAG: hypothetical protein HKN25_03960 [Pyrinomonadaceae bacterium]|nr:hypothetical protein [Pyrinomonadaceae bacterium]
MKFMLLAIFPVLVFCTFLAPAQERNFEIEVSFEDKIISKVSKETLVRVKITNKADEPLNLSGIETIHFFFSKCVLGVVCKEDKHTYSAFASIPSRSPSDPDNPRQLRKNRSFEFDVDLADLYWKDAKGNTFYREDKKNFSVVPNENVYFYARQLSLIGYEKSGDGTIGKVPVYNYTDSNVINVVLDQ